MDEADFDPNETDSEGLPLVYNEAKIADFWRSRPGELAARWAKFGSISGVPLDFWPRSSPGGAYARGGPQLRRISPFCCSAGTAVHMHGASEGAAGAHSSVPSGRGPRP